ncbi:hypothetical protein K438DRAFT_650671 [Mycena galopus ATCC 62051]|nr:hypothetical protein K438DRAFT_650671 [Mycena galopus ATCC 62051]
MPVTFFPSPALIYPANLTSDLGSFHYCSMFWFFSLTWLIGNCVLTKNHRQIRICWYRQRLSPTLTHLCFKAALEFSKRARLFNLSNVVVIILMALEIIPSDPFTLQIQWGVRFLAHPMLLTRYCFS